MSVQSDLRILDSFVILVDCYAVYVKDAEFGSQKDLRNDRCTTQKKWERSPLLIVMFFLNSLGFILRFGRQFVDLKIQFNQRNIKFKYIYRFSLSHLCYIDELIFP